MGKGFLALFAVATLAVGCASNDVRRHDGIATVPASAAASAVVPYDAIHRAAEAAPAGTRGPFVMTVKGSGSQGRHMYLNSEKDYRDQRALTIALPPAVARELTSRLGADPTSALIGRTLLVQGEARRTRIAFVVNGRPSGRYYYQTHVTLSDAGQIALVGDN